MPRITMDMTTDPSDSPTMMAPSVKPLHMVVSANEAQRFWAFLTCLTTKTDVLMPAVTAIIECAGGSPPASTRA